MILEIGREICLALTPRTHQFSIDKHFLGEEKSQRLCRLEIMLI